ncbi:MAG: 30S ribosomal protein S9 [Saprospirales bacterium]|jgi:small subunit ribosomal protein S9|nr:30S ribosomal protein S9 [Saprospirales bacterium]MBK6901240.1 30S ribosomal protein S9 [Saprospirales bacterium]MBK7338064.1 30S ribosomal protein S9 [Saprospirales bacterium]
MEMINALGRRKSSVARVYLMKGDGQILINGKDFREYFPQKHVQANITGPFEVVDAKNIYNVVVNVKGGGFKGQSEAVRMGVSRALVKLNDEFRKSLKDEKFLTRDSREVERKKYGKPKARKSFQFSKR